MTKGKDLDRVRYYSANALTFIEELKDRLEEIPEDKRESTKVELNNSMKTQISNTVENMLLSVGYIYDFPKQDVNDILIRIEQLFITGLFEEYLLELDDERSEYMFDLSLLYPGNLLKYQSVFDIKSSDKTHYSYKEMEIIESSLEELLNICLVILSKGDINEFLDIDSREYKSMVDRYTLRDM